MRRLERSSPGWLVGAAGAFGVTAIVSGEGVVGTVAGAEGTAMPVPVGTGGVPYTISEILRMYWLPGESPGTYKST